MAWDPLSKEAIDAGAAAIQAAMATGAPFFIGRNGSVEMRALSFWKRRRALGDPYPPELLEQLGRNAGLFPATHESVDAWAKEMVTALGQVDCVAAGWFQPLKEAEDAFLWAYAPDAVRVPLRSLEPYYVELSLRWTRHLAGKRVAIVSSFAHTAIRQLQRGPGVSVSLWSAVEAPETILPPAVVEWAGVRSQYPPTVADPGTPCAWPAAIRTWQDAVAYLEAQVHAAKADVALIGCGAIGMVLAGRLVASGVSCVVLGGAVQVLFGIKGRRWQTHGVISKFWNDEWVWPAADEVPTRATTIEGGCYWG